jgi:hypothetical protein
LGVSFLFPSEIDVSACWRNALGFRSCGSCWSEAVHCISIQIPFLFISIACIFIAINQQLFSK